MLNEKLLTREVRKFLSTIDRMTLEIAEIKLEIELADTIALS